MTWSVESVQAVLQGAGIEVLGVAPIPFGDQIKADGIAISVFASGKLLCQGRQAARMRALFETTPVPEWIPQPAPPVTARRARQAPPGAGARAAPVRIVTDYPSARPEDAGCVPPWSD